MPFDPTFDSLTTVDDWSDYKIPDESPVDSDTEPCTKLDISGLNDLLQQSPVVQRLPSNKRTAASDGADGTDGAEASVLRKRTRANVFSHLEADRQEAGVKKSTLLGTVWNSNPDLKAMLIDHYIHSEDAAEYWKQWRRIPRQPTPQLSFTAADVPDIAERCFF
jgi:hypothetical protein